MSIYSLEKYRMKRKRVINLSDGRESQVGVPIISVNKLVISSRFCKALAKMLEQQSIVSSCILISAHSVLISVPSLIKVATFCCSASLNSRNSLLSL